MTAPTRPGTGQRPGLPGRTRTATNRPPPRRIPRPADAHNWLVWVRTRPWPTQFSCAPNRRTEIVRANNNMRLVTLSDHDERYRFAHLGPRNGPRANADETNNRRWGGWNSNPRPADYEKPALMPRCLQLHEQHGPGHLRHSSHQHPPLPRSTNRSTATLNTTANPATERDHGSRRTARLTYPARPSPGLSLPDRRCRGTFPSTTARARAPTVGTLPTVPDAGPASRRVPRKPDRQVRSGPG